MPYEYAVDPDSRLVRVRMWGAISVPEILRTADQIAADLGSSPGYRELIDLRDATVAEISASDVRTLTTLPLDPVASRAFVASNHVVFGLARMFETYRGLDHGKERIGVFRTVEDAVSWLDVHATARTEDR